MGERRPGETITIVAYVLHLVGAITGVLSLVALVINYVKRGEDGPEMDSHHSWMIRSFWWALLWCVVVAVSYLLVVGIFFGWMGFAIVWVWYVYRHLRGLMCLTGGKPLPA
jgi:uncharacterized membrane protein